MQEDTYFGNPTAKDYSAVQGTGTFHFHENDLKGYSVISLIRRLAGMDHKGGGKELEMSAHLGRISGGERVASANGAFIPLDLSCSFGSRALRPGSRVVYGPCGAEQVRSAGDLQNTAGAGAELVFVEPMTFIELLRNSLVVAKMGATFLRDLVGPVTFPSQTAAGTLAWTTEASGSDVTDSFMTFGTVKLVPHSAQSTTGYTRQLLAQSSFDVEAIVRADLVAVNALGIDFAAIAGPGTGGSPKGITVTAGIGSVSIGTNGGPPTWASLVNLQSALFKQNVAVDLSSAGYVTTPGVRGYCLQTPVVAGFPKMIWEKPNELIGFPAMVSNQMPSTLSKGTSSGNCHAAIFGNWRDLLIGTWGVLEIIVDPYRLKKQGIIEVTSFVMVDVGLRYAVSFAADLDLIPTY